MPLHGVCFTEDKMANGLTPGPYSRQEDIFQIFQEPYPVYTPDPNLSDEMNLFLANKQLEARDSGVSLAQRLPHGPLMNWIDSIQTGPTESREGWSLTGSVPMERNIPVHENKKMAAFLDDPTLPSSDYDPSIPVPAGFPSQLETLIASRPEIQQGRSTSGDPLQALKQGNRMRPRGKLKTDIPRYQAPTIPIPRTEPSPQDNSVVSTPSQQRPQQRPQPPNPLAAYDAVMKKEPGFFQENAPLILGLLGGVSGLLEASGPSRVPVSGGQVFARGLQSGLKGYMGGLDYQKGMRTSQQEEAKNVLDATTWREKFQNAELKRQQRVNLGNSIREGLRQLDMETLSPEMKGRAKLVETLVNSGSIESAWQTFSKIAPEKAQIKTLKEGDTMVSLSPDQTVTELFSVPKAVEEKGAPFPQQSFMTGTEVLKSFPNLSGSIDPSQNYLPEYNEQGQIINFEIFDLTEEEKTLTSVPGTIKTGTELNQAQGGKSIYPGTQFYIADENGTWAPANKEAFGQEDDLRGRFEKLASPYAAASESYDAIISAYGAAQEDPVLKGQSDLIIIRAFMLMLEPGSIVRETEFANAAESQGFMQKLLATEDKIAKGAILSDQGRKNFVNASRAYMSQAQKSFGRNIPRYTKIAKSWNLNPGNIVYDPFKGLAGIREWEPIDWNLFDDKALSNSGVTSPFKHTVPNPRGGKLRFGAATIK